MFCFLYRFRSHLCCLDFSYPAGHSFILTFTFIYCKLAANFKKLKVFYGSHKNTSCDLMRPLEVIPTKRPKVTSWSVRLLPLPLRQGIDLRALGRK